MVEGEKNMVPQGSTNISAREAYRLLMKDHEWRAKNHGKFVVVSRTGIEEVTSNIEKFLERTRKDGMSLEGLFFTTVFDPARIVKRQGWSIGEIPNYPYDD